MTNWKELGEIPDSEDEDGFESQITASQQEALLSAEAAAVNPREEDVWDIPPSQGEAHAITNGSSTFRRSTSAIASNSTGQNRQIDPWEIPLSQEEDELAEGHYATSARPPPSQQASEPLSSPLSTLSSIIFDDLPSPTAVVRSDQQSSSDANRQQHVHGSVTIDIIDPSPAVTPSRPIVTDSPAISSELGERESEYIARQAAVRYERSLRARKPIQQHPFLLEMAQYRTSMMGHGLKPLRIAAMESERRRKHDETQEKDWEPGSQESNPGSGSGRLTESQSQILGDMDDWAIPSSSPPSPPAGASRVMHPSSQTSSREGTDRTSVPMDDVGLPDELPALEDLLLHPSRPRNKHTPKRGPTSPRTSSRKKQRRFVLDSDDLVPADPARDQSPDPLVGDRTGQRLSSPLGPVPNFLEARIKSNTARPTSPNKQTPKRPLAVEPASDAMIIDSASDAEDQAPLADQVDGVPDSKGTGSSFESDEQVVNNVGRRIRGVLPASWLRLDQKSGRDSIRKAVVSRSMNKSPEQDQRRGVAQRRQGISRAAAENTQIWSDESEDEVPAQQQPTTDDAFPNQTRLSVNQVLDDPPAFDPWLSDEDADGSGMEDNRVDHMLASKKRQMKLSESFKGAKQRHRSPSKPAASQPNKEPRQTKLATPISSTNAGSSSGLRVPQKRRKARRKDSNTVTRKSFGSKKIPGRRKALPMSILDVIEPDAPRFLKIAARTARQKPNQGRSSPSRKIIRLASRDDHVEASSVLDKWRSGSLNQRAAVSSSVRRRQPPQQTQPLSETSANIVEHRPLFPRAQSSRSAENGSGLTSRDPPKPGTILSKVAKPQENTFRPAQLETDETDPIDSRTFYSGKRALDRLFRKYSTAPSSTDVVSILDDNGLTAGDGAARTTMPVVLDRREPSRGQPSQKSRFRKQTKPLREDVDAPQYLHAHDPLPPPPTDEGPLPPVQLQPEGLKMIGLGPYGTQYTHHFEIFPLPSGVFFHESSLLGRGVLAAVADQPTTASQDTARPRAAYSLGDQVLRWGPWSAQVSSEFGVLFDTMLERLEGSGDHTGALTSTADFILSYIREHMSFEQPSDIKTFFTRYYEVLLAFNGKIGALLATALSSKESGMVVMQRIYERLLISTLCVLQICRSDGTLMSEQLQAEDLFKAVASTTIDILFRRGTEALRQTYRTLKWPRMREKGLREDASAIHAWVTVMKTLDEARILRASFWDLAQACLAKRQPPESHNIAQHESLWKDLFSFLPLTEFSPEGVLLPGERHATVHDGWALPQKLLKTVFQLYRENPRQSPSFNNYCRALVGRCHYLVEHWGWRKSSSIIGVIFDFFGSQNLAHLRNEEVYQSPQFLEHLAAEPRLEVVAEDRCFHVFLKLIAISIQKLKSVGATKDIRNLVARTMPNHSRHFLKEQDLRERDLAALRNHHDLLCTLFWACPPDLRPSATLIESLVEPGTSHKESCLINLRAWSQLTRFLVSNGEASVAKVISPFLSWRDNFFGNVMQQYASVASEVNRQFHSLAKEDRQGVSDDMLNAMISANKMAVQDVLHFSVTSSLEVMKKCSDLEAAVWSLNTRQLQLVFDHFSAAPPELDWPILTAALQTLDVFLSRIEEFKDAEESQQRESQLLDSEQANDALQTLDETVAKRYFTMARCVLSSRGGSSNVGAASMRDKAACKELLVTLSARFAVQLIGSGAMRLSQLFKYSKYAIFDVVSHKMELEQRRYFVLCLVNLLKGNLDHFSEAGFTLLDVWMLAITKPREGLCWENQLAEHLYRIGAEFIPEAAANLAVQPHYASNRDMFEFAITYMRASVREAEPSAKRTLVFEYTQTLKVVMEQMASDLKTISHDATEHPAYVSFVRSIISLIRSHGADICAVDDFFYQISEDYSPPAEDPQLQVAGMISYETKLDDPGARQQLFFFMYNNFKVAMSRNELGEQYKQIRRAMEKPAIRRFVLGKLLPGAFSAAWKTQPAHLLVDVCTRAFESLLAGSILPTELTAAELDALLTAISAMVAGLQQVSPSITEHELHLVNCSLVLLNLVWPSLLVMRISKTDARQYVTVKAALETLREKLERIWLHMQLAGDHSLGETSAFVSQILQSGASASCEDQDVSIFCDNIVNDIQRNWSISEERIGIKTPARSRGTQSATQSGEGVEAAQRDTRELYQEMETQLAEWLQWYDEVFEEGTRGKSMERYQTSDCLIF